MSMWKILYGSWLIPPPPIWKWGNDIKKLKLLAAHADSLEVRQKSKITLYGIYFSTGFIMLACGIGTLL